ncbi:hypothetical protein [Marinobacter nauticus]|uniref:beta-sandwich lipoprotein n=1 Tax=Marinobacter nauticus TaxID=2743 RepID=UPI001C95BE93|nr:hypothetical protein [Marinobacter nauticus]MBY6102343.1 hypothetical protein [Marinobacter nauticus]
MKKVIFAVLATAVLVTGCSSDADVASRNLSKAADQFEINRRIVFYNGITGEYMLNVEGRCSLGSGQSSKSVTVTCKTGPSEYKKHFLGLSDNVTYFAEQIGGADVSVYHYRVIFKPQTIIPNVDFEGSTDALAHDLTK